MATAAALLAGGGVGVGMALSDTSRTTDASTMGAAAVHPAANGNAARATNGAGRDHKVDPARQAWAHKYGVDRATMPNVPDVASATDAQRAAAQDLLDRTRAATAKYADVAAAQAAGYDFARSLARAQTKHPRMAAAMARVDAGQPTKRMPMLHVSNASNHRDGKVLDPNAPETLMYEYTGGGKWQLVGVMYTANEAYPAAPPDPGGPITRWHFHDKSGGQNLMMHVFFASDLAHAYAAEMTGAAPMPAGATGA